MPNEDYLISKELNDALRSKYNPDGSKLRKDQLKLLMMLNIVAGICKEHHITYWLSSGTLLGCARHGGFIPWDDDMDLFMLKKDYKRFLKIIKDYESSEYVFHCTATDPDYVNVFGKFREKTGKIQSRSPRYKYYKYAGIGLDVFAIEKTNYLSAAISGKLYNKVMKSTVTINNNKVRHLYTKLLESLFRFLIFPILHIVGIVNPRHEYHLVLGTGFPKQRMFLKDIFPLQEAVFEGHSYPVPCDIDSYLHNLYGDWRKLPKQTDILSAIHNLEYLEEIRDR